MLRYKTMCRWLRELDWQYALCAHHSRALVFRPLERGLVPVVLQIYGDGSLVRLCIPAVHQWTTQQDTWNVQALIGSAQFEATTTVDLESSGVRLRKLQLAYGVAVLLDLFEMGHAHMKLSHGRLSKSLPQVGGLTDGSY